MQPWQAYVTSNQNGAKDKILAEYNTYLATEGASENVMSWLAFQGKAARRMYALESDEVKKAVEEFRLNKKEITEADQQRCVPSRICRWLQGTDRVI